MASTIARDSDQESLGMGFPSLLVLSLLAVILAATDAGTQTPGPAWRLAVKTAAVSTHDRVRLGEIATPVGEIDPRDWEQLREIELFLAPAQSGKPMSISKTSLYASMEFHLKDLMRNIILPDQMVLQSGGAVYLPADLERLATEVVRPQAVAIDGEAEIRDWSLPPFIFISDGERLVPEVPGAVHPGRVAVKFSVMAPGGKIARQFSAGFFLNLYAQVPVATRPINPSDGEITPDMITFQRRNLAHLRAKIWDGRGGPWRVRSTVGRDQVIYSDNLEYPPAVKKGDAVTLIYEGSSIRITAKGMAMVDGRAGGAITVRNVQSNKVISGTVIDGKTVSVSGSPK